MMMMSQVEKEKGLIEEDSMEIENEESKVRRLGDLEKREMMWPSLLTVVPGESYPH